MARTTTRGLAISNPIKVRSHAHRGPERGVLLRFFDYKGTAYIEYRDDYTGGCKMAPLAKVRPAKAARHSTKRVAKVRAPKLRGAR